MPKKKTAACPTPTPIHVPSVGVRCVARVVSVMRAKGVGVAKLEDTDGIHHGRFGHELVFDLAQAERTTCGLPIEEGDMLTCVVIQRDRGLRADHPKLLQFSASSAETRLSPASELDKLLRNAAALQPEALYRLQYCPQVLELALKSRVQLMPGQARRCGRFFVRALTELPDSESEQWAKLFQDMGLAAALVDERGPLLTQSEEWLKQNILLLVDIAKAFTRFCTSIARLLVPLLRAIVDVWKLAVESGYLSREHTDMALCKLLLDLYRASHPPQPDDPVSLFTWQELPRAVTSQELIGPNKLWGIDAMENLPEVVLDGPYKSRDHYLETYFRLYRADAFLELSEQLCGFLGISKDGKSKMRTYDARDLAIFGDNSLVPELVPTDDKALVYAVRCRPREPGCVRASNLSFGNLLAISLNGKFDDVAWATLVQGPNKRVRAAFRDIASRTRGMTEQQRREETPYIELLFQFATESNGGTQKEAEVIAALSRNPKRALIAENPVFFLAFNPVLGSIRSMSRLPELPFERVLVEVKPLGAPTADYGKQLREVCEAETDIFGTLDPQQRESFDYFTRTPFALIQGPPGTGKSYLGSRIVYSLVKTKPPGSGPIMVMSYKVCHLKHCTIAFFLDRSMTFGGAEPFSG